MRVPYLNSNRDTWLCSKRSRSHLCISLFCRLAGRMRFRGAVKLSGTVLESRHHATDGFVKQHLDDALQQARAEFEIDKEIDPTAARHPFEYPVIVQVFERAFGIGDID